LAAGICFGVAVAWELPPFEPSSATPSPTPEVTPAESTPEQALCPRLERPGLKVSIDEVTTGPSNYVTYEVTVEWMASGGCEPIRGILTRDYLDPPPDRKIYSIWSRAGSLLDKPRCREGRRKLEYVLTLVDAANQRETVKATRSITWPECPSGVVAHE
jgi:hypothetical protein